MMMIFKYNALNYCSNTTCCSWGLISCWISHFIQNIIQNCQKCPDTNAGQTHSHLRNWDICRIVRPTFVSLCRRSVPPGIGTTVWLSSLPLCHSEDAARSGIVWGVRKDGPQLSKLTSCTLLCVLVSVALAPTWRTIFLLTDASWQFSVTTSGKWLLEHLTMIFDGHYALFI